MLLRAHCYRIIDFELTFHLYIYIHSDLLKKIYETVTEQLRKIFCLLAYFKTQTHFDSMEKRNSKKFPENRQQKKLLEFGIMKNMKRCVVTVTRSKNQFSEFS